MNPLSLVPATAATAATVAALAPFLVVAGGPLGGVAS